MISALPRLALGRLPALLLGTMLSASLLAPMPAMAQSDDAARIRKLEAEVKALQRKVFPGADGKYFEPEITAAQPASPAVAAPASGPVTDLLTRMDSVEAALAQMTAQVEVNTNALRLLNARLEAFETANMVTMTPMPVEPNGGIGNGATPPPKQLPPASNTPAPTAPAATGIEKPVTGDAGDDEYVYGFRLWEAGQYGPARTQLQKMLKAYPSHSRASYAQNLLGRAYLDDNKPREAAEAFLKNYLDNRGGARAPDSLVYLSIATLRLGNKAKACEALEEFRLVYPSEASGRLASLSSDTASKAGCK
ncbi:tetratricopeptide repeat protein [Croceicoccus naphthovorans]|uniref:Uncharacterized protein n=1 Tax=Croceicoccus naphthovorans TaxID=1348774 RepID=A0A0G3XJX9_9SPHN|nr:tetratricopeptide repeat protein [Croceicoccus naphthovorans]AKM10911.1 hypothetical protein AB433_14560 [Croceicoccus naphthovorans]MBB3989151.1 TolA-binding protein [Croceicoccus naphthovorans]